jgi:hypothetical protein
MIQIRYVNTNCHPQHVSRRFLKLRCWQLCPRKKRLDIQNSSSRIIWITQKRKELKCLFYWSLEFLCLVHWVKLEHICWDIRLILYLDILSEFFVHQKRQKKGKKKKRGADIFGMDLLLINIKRKQ